MKAELLFSLTAVPLICSAICGLNDELRDMETVMMSEDNESC